MLTIKNILKVIDRKIMGGWMITDISIHPTIGRYIFTIQHFSPIGRVIDSCNISLDRKGIVLRTMTHPDSLSYFFNYNGDRTNICGGADWLADMDNFLGQLEIIIKNYHNKR